MQDTAKLKLTAIPGGATLAVKAAPGASRDRIVGVLGDRLKVAVAAAPEKGKANKAIAAALAKALGLPVADVVLRSGATHPLKEFVIAGVTVEQLRLRLARL